jgi:4-carboxymuconolactone decarboxylase
MTTQRMRPLQRDEMNEAQTHVADALIAGPRGAVRGPFPALLRRPDLADCARAMGDCLRGRSALSVHQKEIIILYVANFWSAHYEWNAHLKIAAQAGLNPEIPDAIAAGRKPKLDRAEDEIVYDFTAALLSKRDVDDATYDRALVAFGEEGIIDIVGTIGYFNFVCMVFNAARITPK